MGDVAFNLGFGLVAVIAGRMTLRAKSLILPGYLSFGMSEDSCWLAQKGSGWLAVALGALMLVSGAVGLAQFLLA